MGKNVILNMGRQGTIRTSGREYQGLLFSKTDKSPSYPAGFIIIDIDEIDGENVISSHSVKRFDKENFTPGSLKGDQYMVVENRSIFPTIFPLDDLKETIKK